MLRKLSSSLSTFKTLEFSNGLNILGADRTQASADTDSRNGAGKSSVVELLHFLLGGRADKKSLPMKPELQGHSFSLDLDWALPAQYQARGTPLTVSRRGTAGNRVILNPFLPFAAQLLLAPEGTVTNSEWQTMIEADLFRLTGDHPCVSGRSMLSYYMRRASAHAFNTATRNFPMQGSTDIAGNLCYLFGLNWRIAADYKDITDKEELRRKLRQAAKDPMLGRLVGNAAELRSQVAVAEQRAATLERQLERFQVVPEYERLKAEADRLTVQIRAENDADVIDRENLTQLEGAVAEEQPPDTEYVERAYGELGIDLPGGVRRSYTAVKEFHDSVVRNRRYYLESEIRTIRERMEERRTRLRDLDTRRAEVMLTLKRGGALESFLSLQGVLAR